MFHIFSTTTATDRQPLYIYLLLVKFTIYTKCKKPTHCDREICCRDSAEKQKRGGEEWKSVDKTARVLRGKRSYCACLLSRKRDSETHTLWWKSPAVQRDHHIPSAVYLFLTVMCLLSYLCVTGTLPQTVSAVVLQGLSVWNGHRLQSLQWKLLPLLKVFVLHGFVVASCRPPSSSRPQLGVISWPTWII